MLLLLRSDSVEIKKDKMVNEGDHLIILGRENISGESGRILLEKVKNFCINKNSKFIIIHSGANSVGAIDVGFTSDIGYQKLLESSDVIFNLGFDEMELPKKDKLLIYQGIKREYYTQAPILFNKKLTMHLHFCFTLIGYYYHRQS